MPEIPAVIEIQRKADGPIVRFVPTTYKRGAKATAGALYPAIESTITLPELIAYMEEDTAKNILVRTLNLFSQNWYESATTGVDAAGNEVPKDFDLEEFKKYAMELSARGLSKDELNEQIAATCDEINSTVMDPTIAPDQKMPILQKLSDRVKSLNLALAARKRKKEDENEPATPPVVK